MTLKEELALKFMKEEDIDRIETHCRARGYAISFREAGVYTINRLHDGAAAKGHDIEEKSIKEKSVGSRFPEIPDCLRGLVGKWRTSSDDTQFRGLEGVYLTRYFNSKYIDSEYARGTQRRFVLFQSAPSTDGMNVNEFISTVREKHGRFSFTMTPADESNVVDQMAVLAEFIRYTKLELGINLYSCFYTGDYDMHDIVKIEGGFGKHYPAADAAIVNNLNADINQGRDLRGLEFNVIRHGPQCHYMSYLFNHPKESIVLNLIHADLPIAFCNCGRWSIIRTYSDLKTYYDSQLHLDIHMIWNLGDGSDLTAISVNRYKSELERYLVFAEEYDLYIQQNRTDMIDKIAQKIESSQKLLAAGTI